MKSYVFIVIHLMTFSLFSQNECKSINRKLHKIDKLVLNGEDYRAQEIISSIDPLSCSNFSTLNHIGDLYYYYNNFDNALLFYFESFSKGYLKSMNSLTLYKLLTSLYKTGNYEKFDLVISDPFFNENQLDNLKFIDLINKNNFALTHKIDSNYFQPVSLSINSNADEYFPSMPIDSDIIIFTYREDNLEFKDENFYISRKVNNTWLNPEKLGNNINSEYREGSLSVSLNGNDLFFTSCSRPDSYGGCDIYYSTLINSLDWSVPINIGYNINSEYWESQPAISSDGNMLFFSSNRHGGYGGSDIWVSKKINNSWSHPINLGPSINTEGDEYTPFLHSDNQTFYFSSNGHLGFGGFDLYRSTMYSDFNFDTIQNLGYPINTHYDESGLIVAKNGIKSYYNSNKLGNLDIYEFDIPSKFSAIPSTLIDGIVIDSISRMPVNCEINITSLDNSWTNTIFPKQDGCFYFTAPVNSNFILTVSSPKYDYFYKEYYLQDNQINKSIEIILNRLKIGNKINLENIYFDFDDYTLKKSSLTELKKFANYLILNSSLIVEIGGHTDNVGSDNYNYDLSRKRAESVYNQLIFFGVDANRLTFKGYGYDRPISTDSSEESRLINRRTEIIVKGYERK
ncbi:MAG: hypothetical protein CMP65_02080 [Flavobacteriales bacterium]|nr:hypothetical protein [Flavobacteriales bacterium]|tara:strand:- start:3854 stop:5731 length:1878 start_codon:yes stop_codon:yes gene_type:complete